MKRENLLCARDDPPTSSGQAALYGTLTTMFFESVPRATRRLQQLNDKLGKDLPLSEIAFSNARVFPVSDDIAEYPAQRCWRRWR